jgi:hypothetical protein
VAETIDICAEFPLGEVVIRQGVNTPRSKGVVHRRQTWDGELTRWPLVFPNMNYGRAVRLRAIWNDTAQGARFVTWTPPGGTAGTYRIMDTELVITQQGENVYSSSLDLMEVP